ncbi:MAG: hypothetical protein V2J55_09230 [Candidatus Competibacteraceae bacterium]|jgi:hypothetical protein|nr:hypothetical protein [Candidatus Competibacteraceae bacterium]
MPNTPAFLIADMLGALDTLARILNDMGFPDNYLDHLTEPDALDWLPPALKVTAALYLNTLPGYRQGDPHRAGDQHDLRLALWRGDAQVIDEDDFAALGLSADAGEDAVVE